MGNRPVVHVCNAKTLHGSRLVMQQTIAPGRAVLSNSLKPAAEMVKAVRDAEEPTTFVFHENMHLPACIAAAAYSKARRKGHRIVFDLQDLAETPASVDHTLRRRMILRTLDTLARATRRLDVQVITVSRGLARIFEEATGNRPGVVYNIPPAEDAPPVVDKNPRRLVYFGMLNWERLPPDTVRQVQAAGFAIDVYGRFSPFAKDFHLELLPAIEAGHGRYLGAYSPDDISFVGQYAGSLLLFTNNRPNYTYAMPNKLFQSLMARTVCIIAPTLVEMRETFGPTGAVRTLDDFLEQQETTDWASVDRIIDQMREESADAYLTAVGWTTADRAGS